MDVDPEIRARMHADVEAPDRILWGLTARQVAILATAAAICYLIWRAVGTRLPLPVVAAMVIPIAGPAVALALGRRDGLPLDVWLWAAIRYRRAPRRAVPAAEGLPPTPGWAPSAGEEPHGLSVLRLPAHAIADDGAVDLGDGSTAVLVAATTINVGLRTGAEQAALAAGYARWLNSLTGPAQVVISAQRVDLTSHAHRVTDAADTLPHPALADAALDYADFLTDIAARRDPLWRAVTIACRATGPQAPVEAARRAEHTAAALAALGAQTRVLDGPTAAAVLTAAVDPYTGAEAAWARALPTRPVTAAQQHREEPT